MAKFNKIIILNKEFKVLLTGKSESETFQIVKKSRYNSSATPSSASFLLTAELNKAFNTNPLKLNILPIEEKRLQLSLSHTSITSHRDNVEDIFPRAVKLFMINYYFKSECKHLNKEELLQIAGTIEINLTLDDVRFIEEITHGRKKSWYWQKLRAGRVTSSKFKSICEANLSNPDKDLLTEIFYPEKGVYAVETNQTERMAMSSFISQMEKLHVNFNCKRVGLVVDRDCPYFAATPAGLCSCRCCGQHLVEIKCPFGAEKQNATVEDLIELKDSFMEVINGTYCLRKDHQFYYQLQMQMALCKCKFAYFYVWSTRFRITNKIVFDSLFWTENSVRALAFAKKVLSIELINSYYTKTY